MALERYMACNDDQVIVYCETDRQGRITEVVADSFLPYEVTYKVSVPGFPVQEGPILANTQGQRWSIPTNIGATRDNVSLQLIGC